MAGSAPPAVGAREVELAAKKMRNNKTSAEDQLVAEMIKYGSAKLKNLILKDFNVILHTGDTHPD